LLGVETAPAPDASVPVCFGDGGRFRWVGRHRTQHWRDDR